MPPRAEQDEIVRFLDYKLAKIDRLISIKQKQMELIKEKISFEFNNIKNNVNNFKQLKHIVSLENKFIAINLDGKYRKLGMYNRGRGIFFREETLGTELGQSSFQNVKPNRLIFSGQFAWEGAVSITRNVPDNALASHRYYLLSPNLNIATPEYLWSYFMSEEGNLILNTCSHGAAGRNKPLNIKELLESKIPLPKIEEQRIIQRIVFYFENFRRMLTRYTNLLQEYRARLISDVVTGTIDVRNWKQNTCSEDK